MKSKYAILIYLILTTIAILIFSFLLSSCNFFFNNKPTPNPTIDTMGVQINAPDEQGNEVYILQVSHDGAKTFGNILTVNSTKKRQYNVEITTDTGYFRLMILQGGNTSFSQIVHENWGY